MSKPTRDRESEPFMQALLVAEFRRVSHAFLRHDPVGLLAPTAEDIHEARTAIRRARSYLRTFAPLLKTGDAVEMRRELRFYGNALGPTRDLDVVGETIAALLAEHEHEPDAALAGVHSLVERRRKRELARVHDLAEDDDYLRVVAIIQRLGAPEFSLHVVIPTTDAVVGLLRRPYRKVRRSKGRGSLREAKDLHELRIHAKELRYATELAEPIFGDPALRLARRSERIQNRIGSARNASLTVEFLKTERARPDLLFALAGGTKVRHAMIHRRLGAKDLIRAAQELADVDRDRLDRDIRALGSDWRDLRRVATRRSR